MFKKFFNWIKSIIKYINDRKLKEFRIRRDIYDIPEDFHTNPKYKVYDDLARLYFPKYSITDRIIMFMAKSVKNTKIVIGTFVTSLIAIGSVFTIVAQKVIK